jgi:hypothetical protein
MHSLYQQYTNGTSISLTGEPSSTMIRGQGDPCAIILPRFSAPCFRNSILHHARGFVSTSELQRLRYCAFRTIFCILKVQFTLHSALSGKQSKAEGMTLSHGLLEIMKKDKENDFHNVLTGDESWFYFEYLHGSA